MLLAYGTFSFYSAGPNPGQSSAGLLRYLTLTQIYTDNYVITYLHQGLSQTWSLAVEVSFYAVLPLLATWLGHSEPSDTYWYLTGTAELLAAATDRLARSHSDQQEQS